MIRRARPGDRAALARLQSHLREPSPELLAAAVGGDGDDNGAGGEEDGEILTPAAALVATADGDAESPVGYLLAVHGDGTTYVAELVVDPEHRREGVATALLSACAAEADRLTVTVAPDNEPARSLYRRCGFEKTRRLPDFFADGAAIRYRRSTDDG
ncbi:GNAT family N-acetyltransferase [Haloplanus pelagicus]|uniref:GNAT family N-acetyltransferase n=1 Tax=Haloplanus pelagicus TaxID=2949995 RepID=UPI00203A9395|nr:N-acetyltransferase [Haloplanus sp. HW8-1]